MGQEVACALRRGKRRSEGKALLETKELLFRPADGGERLKISFSALKSAKAIRGELRLETAEGVTTLELGAAAEKWCQKILHPKTRTEKLGVRAGMNISLIGAFDGGFLRQLSSATKTASDGKLDPNSALIFLSAESAKGLLSGVGKEIGRAHV